MKKYLYGHGKSLSYIAVIVSVVCFVIGFYSDSRVAAVDQDTYKNLKVFNEALDIIDKNYVEKVDPKSVMQGAINGMVKSLDPHSTYLTSDMYKELQTETRGSFGGIGIEITTPQRCPDGGVAHRGHAGLYRRDQIGGSDHQDRRQIHQGHVDSGSGEET